LSRKIAAAGLALGALVVAPVAVSQAGAAAKPKAKVVKIGDNFFAPDSLKVAKNTKIIWRWPKYPGDVHDVRLTKGPKGVKKFKSDFASNSYSFSRTLKKPGTYKLVCSIHAEMKMTIRVKS
jgi:plastocyanin